MHFVGQNIKFFRKQFNLSQCDLADRVGLKRGNIASYEKDIAEPKICNLIKLAQFFKIEISEIVLHDFTTGTDAVEIPINIRTPVLVDTEIQQVIEQSKEFENMINGMKCYHKFQMEKITPSHEVNLLSTEVNRLLSVADSLMKSHKDLIQKISPNEDCPD
jgi:transcriptional regulator with XRE-family HTH domain